MNRLKLIAETSPYWHYTLDYMMSSISSVGFSEMDFWTAAPHYCYADAPKEMRERLREIRGLMRVYDLKAPVFSPEQMVKYPWNIASPDPNMEKRSLEMVTGYLDDAAELGATMVRVGTGWQHLNQQNEENRRRSLCNLQKLADQAEERGLTLIVGTSSKQVGSFAKDLRSLSAYVKEVARGNVLAAVILAEIAENEMNLLECMELFEGRIGCFYLADRGGQVPGKTGDEMERLLTEIQKMDYSGYISVQISFRDCILSPDRWLMESAQWLREKGFMETKRTEKDV